MSNIEQIDFSTLIWVKKELDETLNRAKVALEEYVENPEDENQLQFCATYLHQVQGTLKMVELYGAAMVAEEMEQVAKRILDGNVESEKDAFDVLMRGIILLPDYLERVQLGYKDIPMVLLPLVNDLRTVKGDQLLSESALFNPDLSLGLPGGSLGTSFSFSESQLKQVVNKIRSAFQVYLLNWIKGKNITESLKKLQIIVDKLKTVVSNENEKQLFWVAGGLFDALINEGLDNSVTVKQLTARLDQSIRIIVSDNKEDGQFKYLTKNMLYYVALAKTQSRRVEEIKSFFSLSDFISDEEELEHAKSSISGKNKELLESVTTIIRDDLMTIQEQLDLYIRNEKAENTDLISIVESLEKITDTLGILGIGAVRSSIQKDIEILQKNIETNTRLSNEELMVIAQTLLKTETALDENIASLGKVSTDNHANNLSKISSSEANKIMDSLANESINNLKKIKKNYVTYIESQWDKSCLEDNPKLLKEIGGALKMSGLNDVALEVVKISDFTEKHILDSEIDPTVEQLDLLAEAVASIEYYIEYLSNGTKGEGRILNLAKSNIENLFGLVKANEELAAQSEVLDANLDDMNDDDFSLDDELEDDETEMSIEESELELELEEFNEIEELQINSEENLDTIRPELIVDFNDDTDDDIKEVFIEEFEEELEHINNIFPKWKKNPEDGKSFLGEIRRIYHTLKGSGRLVGASAIGEYSWKLEEMCNQVLEGSNEINDSFIMVLENSNNILPGLFFALKNQSAVPLGYYEIIDAAQKVIDRNEVTEEDFEVKKIAMKESTEVIDSDVILEHTPEEEEIEQDENNSELLGDLEDLNLDDLLPNETSGQIDEKQTSEEILEDEITVGDQEFNDVLEFNEPEDLEKRINSEESEKGELLEEDISFDFELEPLLEGDEEDENIDTQVDETSLESLTENEHKEDELETDFEFDFELEDIDLEEDSNNTSESDVLDEVTDLAESEKDTMLELDLDVEAEPSDVEDDEIFNFKLEDLDLEDQTTEESELELKEPEEIVTAEESLFDDENSESVDELDFAIEDVDFTKEQESADETIEIDAAPEESGVNNDVALEDKPDQDLEDLEEEFNFDLEIDEKEATEIETDNQSDIDESDLSFDPVFVEIFHQEVRSHLDDIDNFLTKARESANSHSTEEFVRVIHTLNGAANMASVKSIVQMTYPLEMYAKSLSDNKHGFSDEDIKQILMLKSETEEIMQDLPGKSENTGLSETVGVYFKNLNDNNEISLESVEVENFDIDEILLDDVLEAKENVKTEVSEEPKVEVEEEPIIETEQEEVITEVEKYAEESSVEHISAEFTDEEKSSEQISTEESNFDDELLEIFNEEATEILDRTEHVLVALEEDPNDISQVEALQRDLHTLKGGARMAGLNNIGNLGHAMESLLEKITEGEQKMVPNTLSVVHDSFDVLNKLVNSESYGQSENVDQNISAITALIGMKGDVDVLEEESKLDQDYLAPIDDSTAPAEIEITDQASTTKKSNVLSGNQIKVNSELLDNLVNYAGEVSIYRSRLEQEVGSFRFNLEELGNTVTRIREQLRKLDIETEAQIISTFQKESEDDESFDPLEMDRFSQLQQLSRSLSESVSDLTSIHSYLDDVARKSDSLLTQQSRVNTELQEGLMETRLVSFNSIVPRLRRLVRTTSKELDKPVKLEVFGAEGEMDKTVLEGVIAPLEHMLRNSLAHGIENDRQASDKESLGTIILNVQREATEVVISVEDDGAGINRSKVHQLAVSKGLIKQGARLTDESIDRLILHSGFSTVDQVSKLAGRGVGMDVVNNQINLLGGTLDIESTPSVGTKFNIRLPYTLALSNALLVEIAETVYAVPVTGLEGIIRMSYPDYLEKIQNDDLEYNYANEVYEMQDLGKILDTDSDVIVENDQVPLVMIRSGDNGVALRVDRILGSREIVVKSVGSQISSVPGIFGATILGDGNVVLILDIIPLSRAYRHKLVLREEDGQDNIQEVVEKDPIVMIVDDSITMRKVGERILRRNEYDVVTAKDGLDALDKLKELVPDVMLLDIEMPRMDGYELAEEMKKIADYANVPIIMITSRTGDKHRQKAMDLGVDRYLGKPYQEADLLHNISDLLEQNKG